MNYSISDAIKSEMGNWKWEQYCILDSTASRMPKVLTRLFESESDAIAQSVYWEIDNKVYVQGNLFDSAIPVTSVLLTALRENDLPKYVVMTIMEIIYQIMTGITDSEEIKNGKVDIEKACISMVGKQWNTIEMIGIKFKSLSGDIDEMRHIINASKA